MFSFGNPSQKINFFPEGSQIQTVMEKEDREKIWKLYPQDYKKGAFLAKELNIPFPVAQILLNRGIGAVEEAKAFLNPTLSYLHSPSAFKDMEPAVDLISWCIRSGRHIAIYGDYDVDGITATAILFSVLRRLGAKVTFYIPDRLREGYGLNKEALDYLERCGVHSLITVDCGISNFEEIRYARQKGMEIIVTDHHQPPQELPEAKAVINPLRKDCAYPFKNLCGAGIAFKLGQALLASEGFEEIIWDYLDMVALGTVADVVPLVGENRIFVAEGLKQMERNPRPGIRALCAAAGLKGGRLTADDIAFILAPRLNAAGRLGDPLRSFYLLLEVEEQKASSLAMELQKENSRRQALEQKVFMEASSLAEKILVREETKFLLLAREGWHPGVLGIAAGRMVERYNLPVILLSLENKMAKGSGRSTEDFDLIDALNKCSSLLSGYGGHRQAAGLTVASEYIPLLREKLNILAKEFWKDRAPSNIFYADLQLEPEEITPELVKALEALEPFGYGNRRPVFYGQKWLLGKKRVVGNQKQHLQLGLQKKNYYFQGISFNSKKKFSSLNLFNTIDLLFCLSFDRWRGNESICLEVFDCINNDEHRGEYFNVIDMRGLKQKLSYVKYLVSPGEGVLLYVNTVARKQYLKKIFAGKGEVSFSHQGSFPADLEEIPQHIVFYDLPLSEANVKQLLSPLIKHLKGKEELYLHLLYNKYDFQENLKLLQATVPAFGSLEQILHFLHNITDKGNITFSDFYVKLSHMLPFRVTKHLLYKSIELFQEADYLAVDERGFLLRNEKAGSDDYCALLKKLAGCSSFQKEREKWEKSLSAQHFLLTAPGEKILSMVNSFTTTET